MNLKELISNKERLLGERALASKNHEAENLLRLDQKIAVINEKLPAFHELDDQYRLTLVRMLINEVLFRLRCRVEVEKKWWWFSRTNAATCLADLKAVSNDSQKTTPELAIALSGAIRALHTQIDKSVYKPLFQSVSRIAIDAEFWNPVEGESATSYKILDDPILNIRYKELTELMSQKQQELETQFALKQRIKAKEQEFGFDTIAGYQNKSESEKRAVEHDLLKREAPNFSLELSVHSAGDSSQAGVTQQPVTSTLFKDVKNAIANIYNNENFNHVDGNEVNEALLLKQVCSQCNWLGTWSAEYKRVKKLLDAAKKNDLDDNLTAETLSRIDRLNKNKDPLLKPYFGCMKIVFEEARLDKNTLQIQEGLKPSPARVKVENSLQQTARAYEKYEGHLTEIYHLERSVSSALMPESGGGILSLFGGSRTSSKDNVALSFMDRVREKVRQPSSDIAKDGGSRRSSSSGSENSPEKVVDEKCRVYRKIAKIFETAQSIKKEAARVAQIILPTNKSYWELAGEIAERNFNEYEVITDKRAIFLISLLEWYLLQEETAENIRLLCQNVKDNVISYFNSASSELFSLDSLRELKKTSSGNRLFTQIETLFPAYKIDRNTGYIVKIREYAKFISGTVNAVQDKSYGTIADLLLRNINQYPNANRDVLAAFTLCQWYLTTDKGKAELVKKAQPLDAGYQCILARLENSVLLPNAAFPEDIFFDMPKNKSGSLGRLFEQVREIAVSGSNAVVQVTRSDSIASINVSTASTPIKGGSAKALFTTPPAQSAPMLISTKTETSARYSQMSNDDEGSPNDDHCSVLSHEEFSQLLAAASNSTKTDSLKQGSSSSLWRSSFCEAHNLSSLPVSASQNNTSMNVDSDGSELARGLLNMLSAHLSRYPYQQLKDIKGALSIRLLEQQNKEHNAALSIKSMMETYLNEGLSVDLSQFDWPESENNSFMKLKAAVVRIVPQLLVSESVIRQSL